ncbi:MAG: nucleoside recognition domain-containing protein [Fluviicola sp.]
MLFNRIWIGFFGIAFLVGTYYLIFEDKVNIYKEMMDALFASAKSAFDVSIGLTGALCFWLGFMRIGEKGGAVQWLSRLISPLFVRIFPGIPKNHPASGSIMMNFSANMLGLDNAATPLGLKAMQEMQELNPDKETASNAQIMFLALNTAGLTIIPVGVLSIRSQFHSDNTTEVFLPILITTFLSALFALIIVAIKQRIRLIDPVILAYFLGGLGFITSLLLCSYWYPQYTEAISNIMGNGILFAIILLFLILAIRKKVVVYEEFIEGAKEGFQVAITIVPYVVAILCAIGLFRASGALDLLLLGIRKLFEIIGMVHTEFVDALPVGLIKPFSGSGGRAMFQSIVESNTKGTIKGVDTFVAKIAATMQGGTETTFYILAVYFGSVKIKNTRYAAGVGLIVDLIGIIIAILVSYLFYQVPAVK